MNNENEELNNDNDSDLAWKNTKAAFIFVKKLKGIIQNDAEKISNETKNYHLVGKGSFIFSITVYFLLIIHEMNHREWVLISVVSNLTDRYTI